jgi:redox-sensitive bicupin YhaK (pirin superfamily)
MDKSSSSYYFSCMKNVRGIERILQAEKELVTPRLYIRRALPSPVKRTIDPFLLLDHIGPKYFHPGEINHFYPHPHRGFQPVTLLLEGKMEHRDSEGNKNILHPGDIHWINAGSGIVHSERLMSEMAGDGGIFHSVQLWINLPARLKMKPPGVQHFRADDIPIITEDMGKISIRLIAGDYYGQQGPIGSSTPIIMAHIKMASGTKTNIPVQKDFNSFYYVLNGKLKDPSGLIIDEHTLATLKHNGTEISIEAIESSELILLGGRPINDPIVCYGPFVMNKFPELQQAIRDYESGKMGALKA